MISNHLGNHLRSSDQLREVFAILRCPRCRGPLVAAQPPADGDRPIHCSNRDCKYADHGFPVISRQPVLIDFDDSIFEEKEFLFRNGNSIIPRDDAAARWTTRVSALMEGRNRVAERYCEKFIHDVKAQSDRPSVLVVGGGAIGSGAERIYSEPTLRVLGTDVYASPNTLVMADAHRLPFCDNSFDGVWIQAVLEHVLNPDTVVAEIHRVLKPHGVVYADTPFMQQVHEGAYDFTRFTVSGHRWLFRKFEHTASGTVKGAGSALVWSIRYFVRALTGSGRIASSVGLALFWLRYFDGLTRERPNADAASAVFFYGRKSSSEVRPREIVDYYSRQASPV
ncbi:MAG: methyltransferase domain-containing protein [Xanthobacteraceae bacterium]